MWVNNNIIITKSELCANEEHARLPAAPSPGAGLLGQGSLGQPGSWLDGQTFVDICRGQQLIFKRECILL